MKEKKKEMQKWKEFLKKSFLKKFTEIETQKRKQIQRNETEKNKKVKDRAKSID